MTTDTLPPTPHEPPWWDGISHRPTVHTGPITPATGAQHVRDTFHNGQKPPWRAPTQEMINDARVSIETIGASSPEYLIAYVTIGNSDDKLEQHDWAGFIRELKETLSDFRGRTYFEGYSAPDATWQNMCICREVHRDDLDRLRAVLRALRKTYRQDSVALVTSGRTELV